MAFHGESGLPPIRYPKRKKIWLQKARAGTPERRFGGVPGTQSAVGPIVVVHIVDR